MALFLEEYEKLRMLGKGSFASVYKVRHHNLGYVRAIKVSNELVTEETDHSYQTFLNECRVLLKIGNGCHPNIVRIYQPRLIANKAIVEMDYVDGESLTKYISREKFIDFDEFRRFALEVVGALAYCHVDLYRFLMDPESDDLESDPDDGSKYVISPHKEAELIHKYGVNHNDLHSNNIMRRSYDGSYVLLDFGLAIQDDHCVKSSSRGDGAYEYCSPEKLEQKETITSASDVYSLGILLYEMLAGRVPFVMETGCALERARFQVFNSHLNDVPPPILPLRREAFSKIHPAAEYTRDYPEELDRIIMRCLNKKPTDRYANAKELLAELKKCFEQFDEERIAAASHVQQAPPPPVVIPSEKAALADKQPNNDAELASLRIQLKKCTDNYELLRRHYLNSQNECENLKGRLRAVEAEARQPQQNKPSVPAVPTVKPASGRGFWAVSILLLAMAVGITGFLWDRKVYFLSYDATIDKVTLGAGVISLFLTFLVGIGRRPHSLLVGASALFATIMAALSIMMSFDKWNYAIAFVAALSIPFVILYWIRADKVASYKDAHDEIVADYA